jgi:GT2 family glycosyltransferase
MNSKVDAFSSTLSNPEVCPETDWPLVYVVMVNWNQCANTLESLRSVAGMDYPRLGIIVVDNGSEDGSPSVIRQEFREVVVLENGENLGHPIALNIGMEYALKRGADYVCLMDNDIVAETQMLQKLVAVAESDAEIAATGPTIYYYDSPDTVWCVGVMVDMKVGDSWQVHAERNVSEILDSQPCSPVDMIPSCALLIKRAALEAVGLMDPRYFVYYNDTDWCIRAIAQGWKIVHVSAAKLWHKISATMKPASPATDYYMTRNVLLFFYCNLRGPRRWLVLTKILLRHLRTIVAYSLKPRHRHLHLNRDARVLALRDAFLGRWGRMGQDVASVCCSDR